MKQFSSSCDQNREPILGIIRGVFADTHSLLEIGSGTGQHAVYFARQLPHLSWRPSDLVESHASINAWRDEAGLENIYPPLALDVDAANWPDEMYDGVFSANTTHIMAWDTVVRMFAGIGRLLEHNGHFCLYGPFNYNGEFTSPSNRQFDAWLKARDPQSGVRDFEAINSLAQDNGMRLLADHVMPANNRLLVWKKPAH